MKGIKKWIKAFRLRTLPLSFSSIFIGFAVALLDFTINYSVLALILITTLLLQIVSNLANDYGDAKKGTDNDNRIGPLRAIQSGDISLNSMKIGIITTSILALISGIILLLTVFKGIIDLTFILFFILGISAIIAAIKYTVGKKAYGYSGMGDLFVFLFFGLVGVLGTYYLLTESIKLSVILPAITIGAFSTAVLNLNNMRDIKNDATVGKNTLVVKMGLEQAKNYHFSLFFWAYLSYFIFCYLQFDKIELLIASCPLFLIGILHIFHIKKVILIKNEKEFDPELKKIALSAFLFSILVLASFLLI